MFIKKILERPLLMKTFSVMLFKMAVFDKFLRNVLSLRHTNRKLHVSAVKWKHVVLKNAKNKTASSQQWLLRQLRDPYVELAKVQNYR